jgi:dolichol-phosphate mannosyltransferase
MYLSIVFPAYNEEKRILPVLEKYYSFFKKKLRKDFELIIVPNNCSDKTFEISKNFSKDKKNVFVENISYYVGKGGAVIKGFELAKGNLIGFVDADESISPEEFFKLYKNIGDNEGIIGSRRMKSSKIISKRKFNKRIGSFGFNFVAKILFNFKYNDTQCGAKIFKKNVAKILVKKNKIKGWIFDIDILNICKKEGFEILEYPLLWKDDEGSHLGFFEGMKSIFELFRYKFTS